MTGFNVIKECLLFAKERGNQLFKGFLGEEKAFDRSLAQRLFLYYTTWVYGQNNVDLFSFYVSLFY